MVCVVRFALWLSAVACYSPFAGCHVLVFCLWPSCVVVCALACLHVCLRDSSVVFVVCRALRVVCCLPFGMR